MQTPILRGVCVRNNRLDLRYEKFWERGGEGGLGGAWGSLRGVFIAREDLPAIVTALSYCLHQGWVVGTLDVSGKIVECRGLSLAVEVTG
ncbi:hypothetical protein Taro_043606 [Colocasia esculenta]|uniref:Uncharacterized protein n=1 Tax=Colocasia esculenta TaxID=4460 RepID=A0A843WLJ4_COLES|nr:hypothetical protein [Colocasia esculenta]